MDARYVQELRNEIMDSNQFLDRDVKILVPGTDNQIQYTRFRDVLTTR
jgi:hypothetical protein